MIFSENITKAIKCLGEHLHNRAVTGQPIVKTECNTCDMQSFCIDLAERIEELSPEDCSVCGKLLHIRDRAETCSHCGKLFCDAHFNDAIIPMEEDTWVLCPNCARKADVREERDGNMIIEVPYYKGTNNGMELPHW